MQTATADRRHLLAKSLAHLSSCGLCEHRCGVNRLAGQTGPCKAGAEARVFRHRIECGEETELIPSHLFYLSGCDLRCAFCIAESSAFDPSVGELLTGEYLRQTIDWGRRQGAVNIQWVGGEPTIHIPSILRAMSECEPLPTVVWKSNLHATPRALDLLDGVVDVYVADFKFGNDSCAKRIAGIDNYLSVVTRNLKIVSGRGDLIVRHLLMPGHDDCCFRPVLEWMDRHLHDSKFSVRDGYLPRWRAHRIPQLARTVDRHSAHKARRLALRLGLRVVE